MRTHQVGVELRSKGSGRAMFPIVQCLHHDPVRSYLEQHGVAPDDIPQEDSLSTWLGLFGDLISQKGSALLDLVSVGQLAVEADTTFTKLLEGALSAVQPGLANYSTPPARSDGNGKNWVVDAIEDGHVQITAATPYPDDLLFGVFYGMACRFLPPDTPFTVRFDDTVPTRDRGGEVTIIHILWE
jgi:hypothetical protein